MNWLVEDPRPEDPRGWDVPTEDMYFGSWTRVLILTVVAAIGVCARMAGDNGDQEVVD